MSRLVELMPEAFRTVAPEPDDILVDDVNVVRLEKAFREIASREANSEGEEITIEVGDEGLKILGYVFQYHSKTSPRIRELLEEYKLANTEFADLYGKPGADAY